MMIIVGINMVEVVNLAIKLIVFAVMYGGTYLITGAIVRHIRDAVKEKFSEITREVNMNEYKKER